MFIYWSLKVEQEVYTKNNWKNFLEGDEFVKAQQNFLAEHCVVFDDKEENKLAYTSIFESYVSA